jgi:acyl-CoA thioesterase-2
MDALAELLSALDLEPTGDDRFRGVSPPFGWQRVFGGQVVAQSVVASDRTVPPERTMHSLNAYFLRPGDPDVAIEFAVERLRDGGSFTTRHVVASQRGRPIFSMTASYQLDEAGLEHQVAMPAAPKPEDLPPEDEFSALVERCASEPIRDYWRRPRPLVLKPTDQRRFLGLPIDDPRQSVWVRTTGPLPDDRRLHQVVLAYLSDLTLLDTSLLVHGRGVFDPTLQVASLDHAMWFHRPARADDWLLYVQESPSTSGGRGFTRGSLFTRDGVLVASVAQEGLIREIAGKR